MNGGAGVIKAVIFDMYETLITHYDCPLYFSAEMAADAGISATAFQRTWRGTEHERSIGELSFEGVIERILRENDCYSEAVLNKIVRKRTATKEECFRHLHPEIIPMLEEIRRREIKIGLISNCFSEEAEVIRRSVLFPYFDGAYLSYEQGIAKPDEEIFRRCTDGLKVCAEECLYVGDGGSFELETAERLGMRAVQAVWYLKGGTMQASKPMNNFVQAANPLDALDLI